MKWKKLYSTEHLDASDIPDSGSLTIKITGVTNITVDGEKGTESKALVRFDTNPAFRKVCNKATWVAAKTCGHCIAAMFGDDTDGWIGKLVTLHSEKVHAFGDVTDAVRVSGSPSITQPITIRVRQGKKKQAIVLRPTAQKPAPAKPEDEPPDPYAEATRLHESGAPAADIEKALTAAGVSGDDAAAWLDVRFGGQE